MAKAKKYNLQIMVTPEFAEDFKKECENEGLKLGQFIEKLLFEHKLRKGK